MNEDEKTGMLKKMKEMMPDPAAALEMQKAMQKVALIVSILPDIEIKEVQRTFKNPDPNGQPIIKEYVVLYIEKKAKQ